MKKFLIGSLTAAIILVSCSKGNDSQYVCDGSYNPCALVAPANEIDSARNYVIAHYSEIVKNAHVGDTVRHCSGMYYVIDSLGTGNSPDVCSVVTFNYTGMLKDSTVFANNQTGQITLGQLIAGFKNVLPLLKEGGGAHLYIPPSLAYGSQQVGSIPANSMLIFKVNLLSVQ